MIKHGENELLCTIIKEEKQQEIYQRQELSKALDIPKPQNEQNEREKREMSEKPNASFKKYEGLKEH
ncbi:MAG TPA: hypothetical protein PKL79_05285, partial [Rectinema sp.]|nr:hypothetical protein [Rectinema sp.]